MIVSSTYFLEQAIAYLAKNIWPWIAIAGLALVSVGIEYALPLPFYLVYAIESLLWAAWCVGVARVVLNVCPYPLREWARGVLFAFQAPWFLLASAFFSGLLAYAAFGMTGHFPVELSFLVLIGALLLELFWWSVSLLVQPRIALGITDIVHHSAFWRALPRRSTELVLKLLIVGFFAACICTALLVQFVAAIEALLGIAAPSMAWIVFFQRAIIALWYALYTISGVYLYRHIVAK